MQLPVPVPKKGNVVAQSTVLEGLLDLAAPIEILYLGGEIVNITAGPNDG